MVQTGDENHCKLEDYHLQFAKLFPKPPVSWLKLCRKLALWKWAWCFSYVQVMKWTGQGLGSPRLFKVENISYLECEYPVNKCLCPNKYSIVKLCLILLVPSDPPNTKLQRWASLVVSQTLHLVPQLSWSRGAGNPSILSSKLFVSEDPDHHLVSQTGWSSGSQTSILSPNTWRLRQDMPAIYLYTIIYKY